MAEWAIGLRFIVSCMVRAWDVIMSVWWLALPIFVTLIFNIIRLMWSISPNSSNRKQ